MAVMQLQRKIDDLLAQRASQWLEVLKDADETQRAEFVEWLWESRVHVQEFLEAVATDRELDRVDPKRIEDVEALLERISPRVVRLDREQSRPRRLRRSGTLFGAIAAAVAMAIGAVLWFSVHFGKSQEFSTQVGEQRTLELPDASVVHLNADSQIEVNLDDKERSVRILHGEALFKVVRDSARPFRVLAHNVSVQVLGTQFNVYERPEGTQVSVLDGRVRVTNDAGEQQLLVAGDEVLAGSNGHLRLNAKANIERSVAWRQRRLIFDNAPLEEMVREFNRYNASKPVRLQGVAPNSHHYDGIFDADDPASLAALLMREKDLAIEVKEREILIRAR
jgi:transmembrane sensor